MVETRRSKRVSSTTKSGSALLESAHPTPKRAKTEVKPAPQLSSKAEPCISKLATCTDEKRPFFWLFKSEPESRMEKGVDVCFCRAVNPSFHSVGPWLFVCVFMCVCVCCLQFSPFGGVVPMSIVGRCKNMESDETFRDFTNMAKPLSVLDEVWY